MNGGQDMIILGTYEGNQVLLEGFDTPEQGRKMLANLRVLFADIERRIVLLEEQQRNPAGKARPLDDQAMAAYLGVSPRKVEELCRRKEIEAFKVGKEWRAYYSDLDAYIAKQKEKQRTTSRVAPPAQPTRPVEVKLRRKEKSG
jgi:excisionase family DNA binding protein